ncbi:MAG: type II secretion system F family protein [Verrucomicrobiota bacterium]
MDIDPLLIVILISILFFFLAIAGAAASFLTKSEKSVVQSRVEKLAKVSEDLKDELNAGIPDLQDQKKSLLSAVDFTPIITKFTGESYFTSLERNLAQADIPLRVSEYMTLRIMMTGLGGLLGLVLANFNLLGILGALTFWALEKIIIPFRKKARLKKFTDQLAEFLILIVNSLRAGQTFVQGCIIAAGESPHPISTEFKQMIKEVNLGMQETQAMENLLVRVPSEDLKIVVSGYVIQKKVGGNLAEILETTADTIRERIKIQGMIDTLTTQGKLSGFIVAGLPFLIGFAINAINPAYLSPLLVEGLGKVLIAVALLMQIIGAFAISRIVTIEV